MDFNSILLNAKPQIIDEAYVALSRCHIVHYQHAGESLTRQRLTDLCDLVIAAIHDRELAHIGAYSEQVAIQRFNAGFDVSEVQTAYNSLEEALWRHAVNEVPNVDLAEAVGLLSTVLGYGKDTLARKYVELASSRHVHSLDLSKLFGGANA